MGLLDFVRTLGHNTGFVPRVPLEDGLREFARWYKANYGVG